MTAAEAHTSVLLQGMEEWLPDKRSPFRDGVRRLRRGRFATVSVVFLLAVIVAAIFASIVAPYDPTAVDVQNRLSGPSLAHPFGTDPIGRDVLSRIVYGSRVSLLVGVVSVVVAMSIGVPMGLISGYLGGIIDETFMRIVDALIAFPGLILALVIVAVLGPSLVNVMIAIGLHSVPVYARIVRVQVLSLREREFVLAARSQGASRSRILVRHILPNAMAPVIVAATLGMSFAVLAEAALGFLGVGVRPPTPTWGGMLNESFAFIFGHGTLSIFPGLAIFLFVLALNFLGDSLRDVLDPRSARALDAR